MLASELELVQQDGMDLQFLSIQSQNTEEICVAAVTNNGWAYQFCSPRMKEAEHVAMLALKQCSHIFTLLPPTLQDCRRVVLYALSQSDTENQGDLQVPVPTIFALVSPRLQHDRQIVLRSVLFNGYALHDIPQRFHDDADIVVAALASEPEAIRFLNSDATVWANHEVIMTAVRKRIDCLRWVHPQLLCDTNFMTEAATVSGYAVEYAHPSLEDETFYVTCAKTDGDALRYMPQCIRACSNVVRAAVQDYGMSLAVASSELQNNVEIVSLAVNRDGLALRFASARLRGMETIVSLAVQQNGAALQFASKELRSNNSLIKDAIRSSLLRLRFIFCKKAEEILQNSNTSLFVGTCINDNLCDYVVRISDHLMNRMDRWKLCKVCAATFFSGQHDCALAFANEDAQTLEMAKFAILEWRYAYACASLERFRSNTALKMMACMEINVNGSITIWQDYKRVFEVLNDLCLFLDTLQTRQTIQDFDENLYTEALMVLQKRKPQVAHIAEFLIQSIHSPKGQVFEEVHKNEFANEFAMQ